MAEDKQSFLKKENLQDMAQKSKLVDEVDLSQ